MAWDEVYAAAGVMSPIVALPLVLLIATRGKRWVIFTAGGLALAVIVVSVVYWHYWDRAFDYADANREIPDLIQRASDFTFALAVAGFALLAALTIATGFSKPLQRPRPVRRAFLP